MDEPVDIFDTNYNYYEQPKPEKKSKGTKTLCNTWLYLL